MKLVCLQAFFCSKFSSPRDTETNCFEANKKLVEAFLKICKGHAALETFSKCMLSLYQERTNFKEDILQMTRNCFL